jgi:hypothetical protein
MTDLDRSQRSLDGLEAALVGQQFAQVLVERGDPVVVERGGRGAGWAAGCWPNASRLRTSCRPTSRSASSAPRRSNLLIATTSAKSSMSIFSNCDAAPNSGVITYIAVSTNGTIAASPCPIPGVSTTTRSNPAAFTTSTTSARWSGSSRAPRVARERKNTRSPSSEFIRIRSPSSAPPPLRRVGSTAITAIRSLSC